VLLALLFMPCFLASAVSADPTAADMLPPVYQLLFSNSIRDRKIFIIGASTVRYDNDLPGDINIAQQHAQYSTRVGWGSELFRYMFKPENVFNQARRGADSTSYQTQPPVEDDAGYKGPGWWGGTRAMIEHTPRAQRGFLLIQFGANDLFHGIDENEFKANLHFYRDQAFELGLTPVFITPVDSRAQGIQRGAYPGYMREVAAEALIGDNVNKTVLLLDLHQKSVNEFGGDTTINLGYTFGNVPYIYLFSGNFQRTDTTHLEPRGAIRVAGWVRDLACDLGDQSLCALFDSERPVAPATLYFSGEYLDSPDVGDPELNGWYMANPDGSIRSDDMVNSNIIDKQHSVELDSEVLSFNTYFDAENRKLEHGFHNNTDPRAWANSTQQHIAWDSRFTSNDFRIYVEVLSLNGLRHFTYKPLDIDEGPGATHPEYLRFGLGTDTTDGSWKSIERDLAADLQQAEPGSNNTILMINGIRILGTGQIDNLRLH